MNCPTCNGVLTDGAKFCVHCGATVPDNVEELNAARRAAEAQAAAAAQAAQAAAAPNYGAGTPAYPGAPTMAATGGAPKQKVIAGILGILFGGFGVHNFYVGKKKTGFIQLGLMVVGILTSWLIIGLFLSLAAVIWGFVEGVLYIIGNGKYGVDGNGQPLS